MTPKQLKDVLIKTCKAKLPVLIKGSPGIGKSDVVKQVSEYLDMDLIISHPVVSDPTDFKGLPGIVNGKAEFLPFGDLRKLIEATKPTIAFLDDLGQAPPVVQAAAMQLILARQVNGHKISDEVVFIGATNRREDMAGVTNILEPVKSRFATIIELEPDVEEWAEWAIQNELPAELIGFIHFRPALLNTGNSTTEIINHPCPRTLTHAGRLMQAGLNDLETLTGAIGEGAAVELISFIRVFESLPDISTIIKYPEKAQVPDNPSTLFAVVSALVDYADKKSIANIIKYSTRLPKDFSVLLVRDILRKDKSIQDTEAFVTWVNHNQDILL